MDTKQTDLLHEWLIAVRVDGLAHQQAEVYYTRMNRVLGVPVVVLTTLVGTTVFSMLAKSPDTRLIIIVGLLSICAAILSSLQTFLGYAGLAEKHGIATDNYSGLRRDVEVQLTKPKFESEDFENFTTSFCACWLAVEKDTPSVPNKIQDRALNRIRQYTKSQMVDDASAA